MAQHPNEKESEAKRPESQEDLGRVPYEDPPPLEEEDPGDADFPIEGQ